MPAKRFVQISFNGISEAEEAYLRVAVFQRATKAFMKTKNRSAKTVSVICSERRHAQKKKKHRIARRIAAARIAAAQSTRWPLRPARRWSVDASQRTAAVAY